MYEAVGIKIAFACKKQFEYVYNALKVCLRQSSFPVPTESQKKEDNSTAIWILFLVCLYKNNASSMQIFNFKHVHFM